MSEQHSRKRKWDVGEPQAHAQQERTRPTLAPTLSNPPQELNHVLQHQKKVRNLQKDLTDPFFFSM